MASVTNNSFDCRTRHQIKQNLKTNSDLGKTASTVGNTITDLEKRYGKLVANPNANPGDVLKLENKIKRAYMSLESLSRIMQNRFHTMMQGIRALSVR